MSRMGEPSNIGQYDNKTDEIKKMMKIVASNEILDIFKDKSIVIANEQAELTEVEASADKPTFLEDLYTIAFELDKAPQFVRVQPEPKGSRQIISQKDIQVKKHQNKDDPPDFKELFNSAADLYTKLVNHMNKTPDYTKNPDEWVQASQDFLKEIGPLAKKLRNEIEDFNDTKLQKKIKAKAGKAIGDANTKPKSYIPAANTMKKGESKKEEKKQQTTLTQDPSSSKRGPKQ